MVTDYSLQEAGHQPTLLASKRHHAIVALYSWLWLWSARECSSATLVLNKKSTETQNAGAHIAAHGRTAALWTSNIQSSLLIDAQPRAAHDLEGHRRVG